MRYSDDLRKPEETIPNAFKHPSAFEAALGPTEFVFHGGESRSRPQAPYDAHLVSNQRPLPAGSLSKETGAAHATPGEAFTSSSWNETA